MSSGDGYEGLDLNGRVLWWDFFRKIFLSNLSGRMKNLIFEFLKDNIERIE